MVGRKTIISAQDEANFTKFTKVRVSDEEDGGSEASISIRKDQWPKRLLGEQGTSRLLVSGIHAETPSLGMRKSECPGRV